MTVYELIQELAECEPNGKVTVNVYSDGMEVEGDFKLGNDYRERCGEGTFYASFDKYTNDIEIYQKKDGSCELTITLD